ncbi:hypothetical protein [Bradyrhizobium sp.]|uniref:hypothetical protein n=1 Tax=Bradyrhizobium sp. TaxID=376 RepID=UPI001DCC962A|nr:hypothetical protein [Bradyrhizobium sp.]MBI5320505.1 hypothetical protein [Bradyrhizobium sp.]
MLMQIQPNVPGAEEPIGSAPPVSVDAADHLEPMREEALLLLRPHRERAVTACMVAGALLAGIALGWAGCLGWNSSVVIAAAPTPKAAAQRHAEARPAGKPESIRKQAPSVTASINASRPAGYAMRTEPDGPKSAAAMLPATPAEPRPQLMPAPETRPATIEGWTVLDVRGQTATLQGPDGVRTVSLGETVPGIGRIDSIVRWGNRWIVATASGLIATP